MRGSVNSGSGLEPKPKWGPKPNWGPKYRASGSRPANGGQQQLSEVLTPLGSDLDSTDVIEVGAPTMPRDWGGHQVGDSSTLQQCRNIGLRDVAGMPAVGGDRGDLDILRKIVESSTFKYCGSQPKSKWVVKGDNGQPLLAGTVKATCIQQLAATILNLRTLEKDACRVYCPTLA